MTGYVALDLEFCSARKTPAAIHHMTKWTLDVLGETQRRNDPRLRHEPCLYRDDRQIKLLHVTLRQDWPGPDSPGYEPRAGLRVFAQPLRDALEDIRVMRDLRSRRDVGDFALDELMDEDDYSEVEQFEEWDTHLPPPSEDTVQNRINDFFARWGAFRNAENAQKSALISMDRLVDLALSIGTRKIATRSSTQSPASANARELEEVKDQHAATHWGNVLRSPFSISLPPLPQTGAERETFKARVETALTEYHRRWLRWEFMLVPLKVTLVVIPPAQGKDLDNLVLDVLPAVHRAFRPHIEPWLFAPIPANSADLEANRAKAVKRLKSLNGDSVTAFQVIELRRSSDDPAAGMLRLVLGLGHGYDHAAQSLWQRNDGKLWNIDLTP
ncbi:hypothetical protein OWR29_26900 [Actinoplanes sp. Pm04-4]|uniref:Uncharacterized protein n=1 Tax=Paractinoplanes pyxinae TaxID=2997416 RepID=A0ABT4B6H8_9ACTN|nr:hypothetical protein [Actinoplanes pyxinae]MCY1141642.1 hypothetical protein [Actinoplanes pyxinae]